MDSNPNKLVSILQCPQRQAEWTISTPAYTQHQLAHQALNWRLAERKQQLLQLLELSSPGSSAEEKQLVTLWTEHSKLQTPTWPADVL